MGAVLTPSSLEPMILRVSNPGQTSEWSSGLQAKPQGDLVAPLGVQSLLGSGLFSLTDHEAVHICNSFVWLFPRSVCTSSGVCFLITTTWCPIADKKHVLPRSVSHEQAEASNSDKHWSLMRTDGSSSVLCWLNLNVLGSCPSVQGTWRHRPGWCRNPSFCTQTNREQFEEQIGVCSNSNTKLLREELEKREEEEDEDSNYSVISSFPFILFFN